MTKFVDHLDIDWKRGEGYAVTASLDDGIRLAAPAIYPTTRAAIAGAIKWLQETHPEISVAGIA